MSADSARQEVSHRIHPSGYKKCKYLQFLMYEVHLLSDDSWMIQHISLNVFFDTYGVVSCI